MNLRSLLDGLLGIQMRVRMTIHDLKTPTAHRGMVSKASGDCCGTDHRHIEAVNRACCDATQTLRKKVQTRLMSAIGT
jgi:hypothetical protein